MLQPEITRSTSDVSRFLIDGLNVKLLACQNLCAETPAIWAVNLATLRVVFLETGHALHFRGNHMEVELCPFRRRARTEFEPVGTDRLLMYLDDFANGKPDLPDVYSAGILDLSKSLPHYGTNGFDVVLMKH
jgi:hypothetical protein